MRRRNNKKERDRTAERSKANITGYFPFNFISFCHLPPLQNVIGFHQVVSRSQFVDYLLHVQSVLSSVNFLYYFKFLVLAVGRLCLFKGRSICLEIYFVCSCSRLNISHTCAWFFLTNILQMYLWAHFKKCFLGFRYMLIFFSI